MATISESMMNFADWSSDQSVGTYLLAAAPISILLLGRFADSYAVVNNAGALFLVTTLTGAYGFFVQFLGEQKLGGIQRQVNGAEIIIPVLASVAAGLLILIWFLPGEPGGTFAPVIRRAIEVSGLESGTPS